jgi:hypothetical protein
MSVTVAAVSASEQKPLKIDSKGDFFKFIKIDAKNDFFKFDSHKNKGNVLNNDKGKDLKVVRISKTANGGKVEMKKNGDFSYKPAKNSRHHDTIKDSFKYEIKDKNGKKDTAKVSITYKFEKHNNRYDDN